MIYHLKGRRLPVLLIPKSTSPVMRLYNVFLRDVFGMKDFMTNFWTTHRLPFQKYTVITYPDRIQNPLAQVGVLAHEMEHVHLIETWHGLFRAIMLGALLPLPVLFSGRWFLERRAYLINIKRGEMTVDHVVETLWNNYGWPWPRPLMRRWFQRQLSKAEA